MTASPWASLAEALFDCYRANDNNHCAFCFIDQQSAGKTPPVCTSRTTTNRLSFLYGSYLTLLRISMLPTGAHRRIQRFSTVVMSSVHATGLRLYAAACWSIPRPACCSTQLGWFARNGACREFMLRWWVCPGP